MTAKVVISVIICIREDEFHVGCATGEYGEFIRHQDVASVTATRFMKISEETFG